jgi:short-subunit dehydrogenase involved in D-alanine esterification of teichoic acids
MVFGYSASKAAIRSYILSAREQLKDVDGSNIKIIELYTPIVQSKLFQNSPRLSRWNYTTDDYFSQPNYTTSSPDGDLTGKLACPSKTL